MNGCQPSTMSSGVIKTTFFHSRIFLNNILALFPLCPPLLLKPSLIKCKRAKGQPFLYDRASRGDVWLPPAFRSSLPPRLPPQLPPVPVMSAQSGGSFIAALFALSLFSAPAISKVLSGVHEAGCRRCRRRPPSCVALLDLDFLLRCSESKSAVKVDFYAHPFLNFFLLHIVQLHSFLFMLSPSPVSPGCSLSPSFWCGV